MLATTPIKRILVRGTNWIGDALLTTPALAALRANFPQAAITVLAREWVAPIYGTHPAVTGVMTIDRTLRHKGFRGLGRLAAEIRVQGFDLAVLFQNAFEAALIVRLARVPLRLGYDSDGRGLLLNLAVHRRPEDRRVHEVEYYLRLLSRSGLTAPWSAPTFHVSDHDRKWAENYLTEAGLRGAFLLGLAPGAAYGPAKQWPADYFANAADLIMADPLTANQLGAALIFGSMSEGQAARRVEEQARIHTLNLAGGTNLTQAAALIEKCGLFLTNDSGLMHLAAAVGTPLVAVFGSTDPTTTSPVGPAVRLIRRPTECAPCLKPVCPKPGHPCMESIRPEEVARAGLELLNEKEPRS